MQNNKKELGVILRLEYHAKFYFFVYIKAGFCRAP